MDRLGGSIGSGGTSVPVTTGGRTGLVDAGTGGRDAGRDAGRDMSLGQGGGGGGKTGAGGSTTEGIDGSTPLIDVCSMTTPLTGGKQTCSNQSGKLSDTDQQWTLWQSGGGGCITPYDVGCAFKANWNNSGDFLARAGFQWNSSKTYDQYGTITADYAFKKTGNGGSYNYIGIYGWTKSPLVEFYIVDDWWSKPNPGSKVGTITVDGDTYTVYKNYRTGAPSIEGTSNFDQFYSVRQTARQCGHINLTAHFDGWSKLNMKMGKMYEAKVLAEAGGGSGSIDFTACTMSAAK
jgi:hypothetical protein